MSDSPDLLVGDAERSAAADALRGHYDAGRITLEEFEGRLASVHAARTESDVRAAFDRLPEATPRPTLSPRDRRWRSLASQYLLINVIAILVWLFSGANGGFWPKWVLVATLIMFVRRAFGHGGRQRRRGLPPATGPGENR